MTQWQIGLLTSDLLKLNFIIYKVKSQLSPQGTICCKVKALVSVAFVSSASLNSLVSYQPTATRWSCCPDIVMEKRCDSVHLGLTFLLGLLLLYFEGERIRLWLQAAEMSFLRRVEVLSITDGVRSLAVWEVLLHLHIERSQVRWSPSG